MTASGASSSKMYLVGATSQNANGATTYTNENCYTQYGGLYSYGRQVLTVDNIQISYTESQFKLWNNLGCYTTFKINLNEAKIGPTQFNQFILITQYIIGDPSNNDDPRFELFIGGIEWLAAANLLVKQSMGQEEIHCYCECLSSESTSSMNITSNITASQYYNDGDEITSLNFKYTFYRSNPVIGNASGNVRQYGYLRAIII